MRWGGLRPTQGDPGVSREGFHAKTRRRQGVAFGGMLRDPLDGKPVLAVRDE